MADPINVKHILDDAAFSARARMLREAGLPVRPRLITFNITDRCNAHCAMCDIHGRKPAGPELTLQQVRRLFADPAMQRLAVLRITGGEPFLRRDIGEIARTAQSRTQVRIIYVTTNGLLPDRVESILKNEARGGDALQLQVSLAALDASHDTLRGVPGARERAIDTLRRLAALRRDYDFHFGINQTVLAHTLDQIEPMHALARDLGAGHSIILGARHHEGKEMARAALNGAPLPFETQEPLAHEQVQAFYDTVAMVKGPLRLRDKDGPAASAFLRELSEAYLNQGGCNRLLYGKYEPAPPCMALFAHARILPHGDVVACSVLADRPIGNVAHRTFGAVWRTARARAVRRRVLRCPGCWIECDIQPSIFYSGDIVPWTVKRLMGEDMDMRQKWERKPRRRGGAEGESDCPAGNFY